MITAVLVNYRNTQDTLACLRSLLMGGPIAAIVVDNSEDPAILADLESRCREFGSACAVIASPANNGFAAGCNIGIRAAIAARADHVLLLNNDTVVAPAFSQAMTEAVRRHPGRVLTGRVRLYEGGPNGHAIGAFTAVLKIDHWMDDARLSRERDVSFASGCLMLIPTAVFAKVGMLDERFFMYGEDVEFCLRLERAGISIRYVPEIEIVHKEGGSAKAANFRGMFYDLRNAVWLAWRGGTALSRLALPFYLLSVFWRHKTDLGKLRLVFRAVGDGLAGRLGKARV